MRAKVKKIIWNKSHYSKIDYKTRIIYISIPFTWELPIVRDRHFTTINAFWDTAIVGGPATKLIPDYFNDLNFVTLGDTWPGALQIFCWEATRTTSGCPRNCRFCGVKKIYPKFMELSDWPDLPVICDDNLLACSQKHFDRVIDRLVKLGWADFNQGIDCRLLSEYHAGRIAEIKKPMIRLALDSINQSDEWELAFEKLRKAGIAKSKIRSYTIIGFDTDPGEAWDRCRWVEDHGIKVLPMWFHELDAMRLNEITEKQKSLGWSQMERKKIMRWYYQHSLEI